MSGEDVWEEVMLVVPGIQTEVIFPDLAFEADLAVYSKNAALYEEVGIPSYITVAPELAFAVTEVCKTGAAKSPIVTVSSENTSKIEVPEMSFTENRLPESESVTENNSPNEPFIESMGLEEPLPTTVNCWLPELETVNDPVTFEGPITAKLPVILADPVNGNPVPVGTFNAYDAVTAYEDVRGLIMRGCPFMEPVILKEPEREISYASVLVNASID